MLPEFFFGHEHSVLATGHDFGIVSNERHIIFNIFCLPCFGHFFHVDINSLFVVVHSLIFGGNGVVDGKNQGKNSGHNGDGEVSFFSFFSPCFWFLKKHFSLFYIMH